MSPKRIIFFLALTLFLFQGISPAWADIYRFKDENGVWHFTNINNDIRYKLFIRTYAKKPEKYIADYGYMIDQASERFNIDPNLVKAVIKAESDFDKGALSSKGAQGLMQLMPKTADEMEVDDPFNPEENIFGGTRYLSILLERFNNDKNLALAAYNAGPEKVAEYNGIPPYNETRNFVRKVLDYYEEYRSLNR
ncbi:MAG: lytic transglycosylase domain-containing protein [Deltaproteobacteria bacterium]|nr:lytic transglycosylase domain-containing protein [Deltaproteobacteria bacterium]